MAGKGQSHGAGHPIDLAAAVRQDHSEAKELFADVMAASDADAKAEANARNSRNCRCSGNRSLTSDESRWCGRFMLRSAWHRPMRIRTLRGRDRQFDRGPMIAVSDRIRDAIRSKR